MVPRDAMEDGSGYGTGTATATAPFNTTAATTVSTTGTTTTTTTTTATHQPALGTATATTPTPTSAIAGTGIQKSNSGVSISHSSSTGNMGKKFGAPVVQAGFVIPSTGSATSHRALGESGRAASTSSLRSAESNGSSGNLLHLASGGSGRASESAVTTLTSTTSASATSVVSATHSESKVEVILPQEASPAVRGGSAEPAESILSRKNSGSGTMLNELRTNPPSTLQTPVVGHSTAAAPEDSPPASRALVGQLTRSISDYNRPARSLLTEGLQTHSVMVQQQRTRGVSVNYRDATSSLGSSGSPANGNHGVLFGSTLADGATRSRHSSSANGTDDFGDEPEDTAALPRRATIRRVATVINLSTFNSRYEDDDLN